MKWVPLCGVFILAAALTPAAQQNPIVRPGAGTPQPTPQPAAPLRDPAAAPTTGTAHIRGRE